MMKHIKKCINCGEYTLSEICKKCGSPTREIRNYKFMINEKYIKYRLKEKGYL